MRLSRHMEPFGDGEVQAAPTGALEKGKTPSSLTREKTTTTQNSEREGTTKMNAPRVRPVCPRRGQCALLGVGAFRQPSSFKVPSRM